MTDSAHPVLGWPRPLAFVLSGGASWGAAQVGMLRALAECDIRPDLIVGSSAGALNGSMLAADPFDAARRLEAIWRHLNWLGLSGGGSRLGALWNMVRTTTSVTHPAGLATSIDKWLLAERFEYLKIPFGAVVTDTETGSPTVLTSGPLTPALQASAAIPGVFPPVVINGRSYLDGGVTANLPLRQAVDLGAASIVALDATPSLPRPWPPAGMVSAMFTASAVMLHNQRADDLDHLDDPPPVLRLPQVTPASLSSFDFRLTPLLIEAGYRNTLNTLAELDTVPTDDPTTDDPTADGHRRDGRPSVEPAADREWSEPPLAPLPARGGGIRRG